LGLFDKIKASTTEAKKRAQEYAEETKDYAEKKYKNERWYNSAKEIGNMTKDIANESMKLGEELFGEVGKTNVGKKIGNTSRKFIKILMKIPLLTITSDVIKSKNGVNELYQLVQEDPCDAERYIWLAEAMKRVKRDRNIYIGFKNIIDPSSIIFRETIKTAIKLGLEETDPIEIKILKNAYSLSIKELKNNPRDAKNLHVLSRVYLLMGEVEDCIKSAKLAILADSNNKLPYITLSRAYLLIEQYSNSKNAAKIATSYNYNYAYDIIAQLVLLDDNKEFAKKIEEYSSYKDIIEPKDKEKYLGCKIDELKIIESIGREQMIKFSKAIEEAKKI